MSKEQRLVTHVDLSIWERDVNYYLMDGWSLTPDSIKIGSEPDKSPFYIAIVEKEKLELPPTPCSFISTVTTEIGDNKA